MQFEFPTGISFVIQKVLLECIVGGNQTYNIRDTALLASNDKTTWDTIFVDSNPSDSKTIIITPDPPKYKYLKLVFTGHGNANPHLEKVHFYGEFWK